MPRAPRPRTTRPRERHRVGRGRNRAGLRIQALAKDLKNPRSLYVLPNGDILVVESDGPKPPAPARPKEFVMNWIENRAHSSTKAGGGAARAFVAARREP